MLKTSNLCATFYPAFEKNKLFPSKVPYSIQKYP